jgi:hypothetical protein
MKATNERVSQNEPQQEQLTTAVVRFRLPPGAARGAAKFLFEGTTPAHRQIPGLIRTYYLYGDGPVGAGLHLWSDREAAERFYTAEWRKELTQRFGVQLEVLFIERSVPIDDASDKHSSRVTHPSAGKARD